MQQLPLPLDCSSPLRVAHVITALTTGGAEVMLLRLLKATPAATERCVVVTLKPGGAIQEQIAALGVPLVTLNLGRGLPHPWVVPRLARLLRDGRFDIVQTWLYHADLIGGLAARRAGLPVVWGIHNTTLDPRRTSWTSRLTRRWLVRLSHRLPTAILCCSQVAAQMHRDLGYREDKLVVVPNGFDLAEFEPHPEWRSAVRNELDLPQEAPVVGIIARFHPQKDHATFVAAAAWVARQLPGAHFVLCGREVTADNAELVGWLRAAGLGPTVRLLGDRRDVPRLLAAVDVVCNSSSSEAMPLAIGEAMASGLPVAATDVGDSAAMIGATGRVVPPSDGAALGAALLDLLSLEPAERAALGEAARQRVATLYSLEATAAGYERVWRQSLAARQTGRPAG